MQYNYICPRCHEILVPEAYESEMDDNTQLVYTHEFYECFNCNAFVKISAIIDIRDTL